MQDPEQQRPLRQSSLNHTHNSASDEETTEDERPDLAPEETPASSPPSRSDLFFLSGTGIVGGLLAMLLPIAITLLTTSTYQEAGRLGDKMPYGTAVTIFWLGVTYYILELLISLGVGFIVGRQTQRRLFGFYAGLIVGTISYIGNVIVHYIPGYPDRLNSTVSNPGGLAVAGAILFLVGVLVVRALIDGLLSMWGARLAIRQHPSYEDQEA
jgi:hypothetical protein